MGLGLFIARRIHFDKDGEGRTVSKPAVRIAVAGVAIGLAVMIIAMAIITGFKHEIRSKLAGFGSHIQITDYNNNNTYETAPVSFSEELKKQISEIDGVRHCNEFCTKPGILKTDDDFLGIVLKGVDSNYDPSFFAENLQEGSLPQFADEVSNEVLISKRIANKLGLECGDKITAYFFGDNIRARRFTISGIYSTGLQQFDEMFVLGDLRHIQKLNGWTEKQYSGMEVALEDFSLCDEVAYEIFAITANRFNEDGSSYYTRSIKELQPAIFAWLDLLDLNVAVILALMSIVAGFNIVSALLILILDKTSMIGLLKALGARDRSISKVFLIQASFLIGKGLLWGNAIGLVLCLLQYCFHIIPLDAEVYFVDFVPVMVLPLHLLLVNVIAALAALASLLIPSGIVSKVLPAKSIRFE